MAVVGFKDSGLARFLGRVDVVKCISVNVGHSHVGLGELGIDGESSLCKLAGLAEMGLVGIEVAVVEALDHGESGESGGVVGIELQGLLEIAPSGFEVLGKVDEIHQGAASEIGLIGLRVLS